MEPGTKVAIISKSGEGATHVAISDDKPSDKAAPPSSPAKDKKEEPKPKEDPKPKVETKPVLEKPKGSSPPPSKASATELQLPPKEKERRMSFNILTERYWCSLKVLSSYSYDMFESITLESSLMTGSYDKAKKTCCHTIERFPEHICIVDDIQRS